MQSIQTVQVQEPCLFHEGMPVQKLLLLFIGKRNVLWDLALKSQRIRCPPCAIA